jgi:hypothetical protein
MSGEQMEALWQLLKMEAMYKRYARGPEGGGPVTPRLTETIEYMQTPIPRC